MIEPLMQKAADQPLSEPDIEAACKYLYLTRPELFDAISRRVAEGYSSGELSFDFCDAVMNRLYFMLMTYDAPIPEYTKSVFIAFDDGEYDHTKDPLGSSPEELHTKPQIAEILARGKPVT